MAKAYLVENNADTFIVIPGTNQYYPDPSYGLIGEFLCEDTDFEDWVGQEIDCIPEGMTDDRTIAELFGNIVEIRP